jgi:hypothetical protein
MTPEDHERIDAKYVLSTARVLAVEVAQPDDRIAYTAAILCRALELATPELSPQGRARLFMEEEL